MAVIAESHAHILVIILGPFIHQSDIKYNIVSYRSTYDAFPAILGSLIITWLIFACNYGWKLYSVLVTIIIPLLD